MCIIHIIQQTCEYYYKKVINPRLKYSIKNKQYKGTLITIQSHKSH